MSALAAGAAAAGRTGGASGGFAQFAEGMSGFSADINEMKGVIGEAKNSLAPFTEALGKFKTAASVLFPIFVPLIEVFSRFGKALAPLLTFVPDLVKYFIDLGKEISQFVRLASPATVQKFNFALDDLHALIGRALTPVLELVTKVIRNVADSMGFLGGIGANLARGLQPFARALETVFEWVGRLGNGLSRLSTGLGASLSIVGEAFDAFMKALEPLGNLLIDLVFGALNGILGTSGPLEDVVAGIVGFARALADLTKWIARTVRELLAFVGISLPDEPGTRPGSSVGAAMRPANIGSIESSLQKALTSAFSLGTAASSPEARTASAAEALKAKADQIYNELSKIVAYAEVIAKGIGEALKGPLNAAVRATDAIVNPIDAAGRKANAFLDRNFGVSF